MPAADARVCAARRSAFLVKVHSQGGPLIIRPAGAEGDAPPLDADGRCSTPLPGMPRVRRPAYNTACDAAPSVRLTRARAFRRCGADDDK